MQVTPTRGSGAKTPPTGPPGARRSSSRSRPSRTGTRTSYAQFADRVLFCDTDAWTTGLFHEVYLGKRSPEVDAYADREYDLYILCDPETPFAQDELGTRPDGPHRRRMHEAYLEHVRETGKPYVVVTGSHAERMAAATAAVDALLGVTLPPRRLPVPARPAGSARSRSRTPASRC